MASSRWNFRIGQSRNDVGYGNVVTSVHLGPFPHRSLSKFPHNYIDGFNTSFVTLKVCQNYRTELKGIIDLR